MVETVGHADIEHAAEGEHRREPRPVAGAPLDDGGRHRAGLRHEGEVARGGRVGEQAGVELGPRHGEAGAVGAEQAQAVRAGDPVGGRARIVRAGTEPGRQDHGRPGAGRRRLGDDLRHARGRHRDQDEVGRGGQVGDLGDAGEAVHLRVVGLHRQDRAGEAGRPQPVQHAARHRALARHRSDQRDRLRCQQLVEPIGAHGAAITGSGPAGQSCRRAWGVPRSRRDQARIQVPEIRFHGHITWACHSALTDGAIGRAGNAGWSRPPRRPITVRSAIVRGACRHPSDQISGDLCPLENGRYGHL